MGGTLHTLDIAKVSNVDKAKENAAAFAQEVIRLMPAHVIRSPRLRVFPFGRHAA